MTGFLKRAAGVFVDLDDTPPASLAKASVADQASVLGRAPTNIVISGTPTVNSEMVDTITKRCLSAASDYNVFLDAVSKLQNVPMDDKIRFQSAMAMIATSNRNAATVLAALDAHIVSLSKQTDEFKAASEGTRRSSVQGLLSSAATLKDENAATQVQINDLTKTLKVLQDKIAANTGDIAGLEQKAKVEGAKIDQVEANFQASVESVVKILTEQKSVLSSLFTK